MMKLIQILGIHMCVCACVHARAFEKAPVSFAMSFYLSSTDSSQIVGLILMKLSIIDMTVFLSSNFNR